MATTVLGATWLLSLPIASERWQLGSARSLLLVALLLVAPLIFASGALVDAAPCPFCLLFWSGIGLAAAVDLRRVRGGTLLIAVVALATLVLTGVSRGGSNAAFVAGPIRSLLEGVGFFPAPAPALGNGDPIAVPAEARFVVFATHCASCTAFTAGAKLRHLQAKSTETVITVPDADRGYLAPQGFVDSRCIESRSLWGRARLIDQGPPALYIVRNGVINGVVR